MLAGSGVIQQDRTGAELAAQLSASGAQQQSDERHFDSSLLHHAKVCFRNAAVGDDLL